ncbi:hypothetical protein GJ496_007226 [Pomphorhynchus laevis]|nr:hypothetical protein GJ496_007226 [Pomphorhynchus laevis]
MPDATKSAFDSDGYFKTGDIGFFDPELKSYRILGRKSIDIIKSGGYKISAVEIERVLQSHPDILECAVLGITDKTWGQVVTAIIVPKMQAHNLSLKTIREFCSTNLPKYSLPKIVHIRETLFSRTAVGKIDKKSLSKEYS